MRKTSENGLHFIREAEGCRLTAYQDSGGVWTIGVGHTAGVKPGQRATMAEVEEWLREDVGDSEDAVASLVKVALTQNQYDALVSFVFNLGATQFSDSTLLKKLNAGDYKGAQGQFKRWVYDNGEIQPGLVKRRNGEAMLFGTAQ
jgi:lysozyme